MSVWLPALLAGAAAALAAWGLIVLAESAAILAGPRAARMRGGGLFLVASVSEPLRRAGAEGIVPSDQERLRLRVVAALGGFALGSMVFGVVAGVALAPASAWLAARSLVWHRSRYARRLDTGAAAAALALAEALAGGHSIRGALGTAGRSLEGPIAIELRRVAQELELGGETEAALERFRRRARSRRVDLIVAAVRIQRRSGGNLAGLLRQIAAAIDDHDRVQDEARAASEQARFTSLVVILLPVCGLLLGELVSPGMVGRMAGSVAGVWLCGTALLLQIAGLVLIRRLGRVEP